MSIKQNSLNNLSSLFKKTQQSAEPKVGDLVRLSIKDVISHDQVRKKFRDLEGLAASIKELGLQQPINVLPRNRAGKYVILQGERRWRACQLLGMSHIDAVIRELPATDQKRILSQLTENIQRDDMDPVELARAVKTLTDNGMKGKEIASALGKSQSYISSYLSLTDLPEQVESLRQEYELRDPTILNLLRQMFEIDPIQAEYLLSTAIARGNGLTRSLVQNLKDLLSNQKKKVEPQPPVQETQSEQGPAQTRDTEESDAGKHEKEASELTTQAQKPQQAYRSVPNGAEQVQTPVRVYVLALIPGSEKPVLGYIAPDLVSKIPDTVCVVVKDTAYVLATKYVVINRVETK